MTTFQSYDPSTRLTQSQPKACEHCYARKVKCDIAEGDATCRNCLNHGIPCRQRTRKRKAASIDQGINSNTSAIVHSERDRRESLPAHQSRIYRRQQESDIRDDQISDASCSPNAPLGHEEDSDLAAPFLFIGHRNALARSPGTTTDAVPSSVDEFHNSSYLSRSAILGDDFPDIDHSHNTLQPQHKISPVELQVLKLYQAFDLPELPLRQSLIEAYASKIYTWMPVVDASSLSVGSPNSDTSLLLLQAVLLVGALMRPDTCSKGIVDSYYRRVKALINSSYERNPLNMLAALCLIQWFTPGAPKDVSTDTPRYWISCALGIAQQIGLHLQPDRRSRDFKLRRRIWWTLYVRDSIMSAAHGRPRMLSATDSTMEEPSIDDFDTPEDTRAHVFVHYVRIAGILCDLSHAVARRGSASPQERDTLIRRLLEYGRNLPSALKLVPQDDTQRPYNFDLAQLHIPFLTAISILYRPQSIFALTSANAASVAAANLSFRIFQAIQLREETRALSSAFSYHLLVCAIPHLSSLRVEELKAEANCALDALEVVLQTLGTVRPAAANNLRNVKTIRKAIEARDQPSLRASRRSSIDAGRKETNLDPALSELFSQYGPQAIRNLESVVSVLRAAEEVSPPMQNQESTAHPNTNGKSTPNMGTGLTPLSGQAAMPDDDDVNFAGMEDNGDSFSALFGTHFQDNMWMRNWIDDLQLQPGSYP